MKNEIISVLKNLFDYYWDMPMTEEEETETENTAQSLITKYGWEEVFEHFFYYLKTECSTPESVANAMNIFSTYGWSKNPIPDPYDFLGYIYYRIELNPNEYDDYNAVTTFDSIAVDVLEKSGIKENLYIGDYVPEIDPEVIKAVEKWRSKDVT